MAKFSNSLVPKKAKTPTYNLTEAQINQIRQEGRREGMRAGTYVANAMYSAAMLICLRDKLGFGRIRMTRFFRAVQSLFNEIAADEVKYLEVMRAVHDECGVNLIIERPKGMPVDALDLFRKIEVAKSGYSVKIM